MDFILEHHPNISRRLTQAEALDLLEAEHRRGHVHSALFKDAMLDRFYTICNCCKCGCGGIEAMVKHGVPVVAPSGYIAQVDETLCSGGGLCAKVCSFNAIQMNHKPILDWNKCMRRRIGGSNST